MPSSPLTFVPILLTVTKLTMELQPKVKKAGHPCKGTTIASSSARACSPLSLNRISALFRALLSHSLALLHTLPATIDKWAYVPHSSAGPSPSCSLVYSTLTIVVPCCPHCSPLCHGLWNWRILLCQPLQANGGHKLGAAESLCASIAASSFTLECLSCRRLATSFSLAASYVAMCLLSSASSTLSPLLTVLSGSSYLALRLL